MKAPDKVRVIAFDVEGRKCSVELGDKFGRFYEEGEHVASFGTPFRENEVEWVMAAMYHGKLVFAHPNIIPHYLDRMNGVFICRPFSFS